MKKVRRLLNIYKLLIIGLVIGTVISLVVVYYAAPIYFDGTAVGYNNQASGLTSTDVSGALTELYEKATTNEIVKKLAAADGTTPAVTATGTYDTTCNSQTCSKRSISYSYSAGTSGNFEIDLDSWVYDMSNAQMGGHQVVFRGSSTDIIVISNVDSWSGSTTMGFSVTINGTPVSSTSYTSGTGIQGTTKIKIVRQNGALTVYRNGETFYYTASNSTNFNIDTIETRFLKYGSNIVVPSSVSNIYVGPIKS